MKTAVSRFTGFTRNLPLPAGRQAHISKLETKKKKFKVYLTLHYSVY